MSPLRLLKSGDRLCFNNNQLIAGERRDDIEKHSKPDRSRQVATQYKVISDWLCLTTGQKARKIERHLNALSIEGWEFVALDAVMVFGFDVGFYLVLKQSFPNHTSIQ